MRFQILSVYGIRDHSPGIGIRDPGWDHRPGIPGHKSWDDELIGACKSHAGDREAEQFILRRSEERRLKNLANGLLDNKSDDSDDESQEEENLAEVEDEESSSRTRFEAGRSRSGRRVTRYLL